LYQPSAPRVLEANNNKPSNDKKQKKYNIKIKYGLSLIARQSKKLNKITNKIPAPKKMSCFSNKRKSFLFKEIP